MISICLVLHAHEPWRLRPYNYFDVGRRHDYFDTDGLRRRIARAGSLCYGPATEMLARLLERHPRFSFSLALSGPLLAHLAELDSARLAGLRGLVETGRVEPLCATSHGCLPWPVSSADLSAQIELHRERLHEHLGREPVVFGGEQPSDAGALAALAESVGLSGILLDGSGTTGSAHPRQLFRAPSPSDLLTMVCDTRLSEDLAHRLLSAPPAQGHLTREEFEGWLSAGPGDHVGLSLDLAIFGLRHRRESGIFAAFEAWVSGALSGDELDFATPSDVFRRQGPAAVLRRCATSVPASNEMQQDALRALAELETRVRTATKPEVEDFRRLTSADHFREMTLTAGDSGASSDGALESPYEAYMTFRHVVSDLERRLPRLRPDRPLAAGSISA
jgi:alpha-amylase